MKITNTAPGPRGIYTKSGYVQIAPGASAEVDFDGKLASYFKAAKAPARKTAKGKGED